MQTAYFASLSCLLLAVAFLAPSVQGGGIIVNSPQTKALSIPGDGFGVVTMCSDKVAAIGGNVGDSTLDYLVTSFTYVSTGFTIARTGVVYEQVTTRHLGANVPLRLDVTANKAYVVNEATRDFTSDAAYALSINCSLLDPGLSGAPRWASSKPISLGLDADLRDFAGATVGNRYLTWAGGEKTGFKGNVTAGTDYMTYSNVSKVIAVIDGASNDTTSALSLSVARSALASASLADGSAWYGGGMYRVENKFFNTIDIIYPNLTMDSSKYTLSEARSYLGAASNGGVVAFGGGVTDFVDTGNGTIEAQFSSRVDIFNTKTGTHTTHELSEARGYLSAIASQDFIVFVGGVSHQVFDSTTWNLVNQTESIRVDYYHVASETWAKGVITMGKYRFSGVAFGNDIFVSPGSSFSNGALQLGIVGDVLTFSYDSAASSLHPFYSTLLSFLVSFF